MTREQKFRVWAFVVSAGVVVGARVVAPRWGLFVVAVLMFLAMIIAEVRG